MRLRGRRVVSVVAIYVIVLHAILWSVVAPMAAGSLADPFSAICHSEAAAPAEQSPAAPAHTCDHCNICGATPAPAALDSILAGQLAPARLLHVMLPASGATHGHLATRFHRARGPPAFA